MSLNRRLAAASVVFTVLVAAQCSWAQSTSAELTLPDDPSFSAQQITPAQGTAAAKDAASQAAQDAERKRQLEEQEHQRVMGVMATFNTTSNRDALPLTPKQKFQLFFKSATDPWPFMLTAVVAGIGQADDSFPAYGQGAEGYAKRYGAAYTDYFVGNFFGNAVLPIVLHEDPRYFQKGTGNKFARFWWAAGSTVWCKRDNGTWGPNFANVGGNLIGAAISNVYYPQSERTVSDTIERGFTVSAEGIVGAEVIEFWPDIARRHRRKQAEKLARQAARQSAQQPPPPPAPQN